MEEPCLGVEPDMIGTERYRFDLGFLAKTRLRRRLFGALDVFYRAEKNYAFGSLRKQVSRPSKKMALGTNRHSRHQNKETPCPSPRTKFREAVPFERVRVQP